MIFFHIHLIDPMKLKFNQSQRDVNILSQLIKSESRLKYEKKYLFSILFFETNRKSYLIIRKCNWPLGRLDHKPFTESYKQ